MLQLRPLTPEEHITITRLRQSRTATTGQDPQAIERTRAAADLVRSFALFGFLEYLLWATQAVFLFLIVAEVRKMADRFADLFPSRSERG